jgi:hypothetical protein
MHSSRIGERIGDLSSTNVATGRNALQVPKTPFSGNVGLAITFDFAYLLKRLFLGGAFDMVDNIYEHRTLAGFKFKADLFG